VKFVGKSSQTRQAALEFVFAIQLAGEVREILVVKATAKGEFFANNYRIDTFNASPTGYARQVH
jgi:hypothetical protein